MGAVDFDGPGVGAFGRGFEAAPSFAAIPSSAAIPSVTTVSAALPFAALPTSAISGAGADAFLAADFRAAFLAGFAAPSSSA